MFSEVVQPTGGLAGAGAVRVLGRPKLSALSLALRETIQNSWDARKASRIGFTIERRRLGPESIRRFSELVFPGANRVDLDIAKLLKAHPEILILTDERTVGLEGPVRADEVRDKEPRRFVDFFRNIGSHQEVVGSGGTYGFGKTSLYRLSRSRAIAAFTRGKPAPKAAVVSRFMAAAIGPSCRVDGRLLTGRHWWGDLPAPRDPVVDPLVGEEADDFAALLSLHPMTGTSSGTTIVVLSPDIESKDEFQEEVVETVLFNFWPKMLDRNGDGPDIDFRFVDDDEEIEIVDPRAHPKIAPFVHAYSALYRSTKAVDSRLISVVAGGSEVDVGHLAVTRTHVRPGDGERKKHWEPFGELSHHVCLLRSPELVVKYERTQAPVGLGSGYAAVFRALDEHDSVFADSEPPAHDDWEPSSLEKRDRELVNRTLREIRQRMKDFSSGSSADASTSQSLTPLGGLATFLGELLDGVDGDGPGVEASSGSQSPSRTRVPRRSQKARVEVSKAEIAPCDEDANSVLANVAIVVTAPRAGTRIRVRADAGVQTADGLEGDAPENAPSVEVVSWRDERGVNIGSGNEIALVASPPRRLSVSVRVPSRVLGALRFSCPSDEAS